MTATAEAPTGRPNMPGFSRGTLPSAENSGILSAGVLILGRFRMPSVGFSPWAGGAYQPSSFS